MVPLQIFSMCCSWLAAFSKHNEDFPPTHSNTPLIAVVVKMKILFNLSTLLGAVLLLFYYLFYDCIKWPIVKVNDSQRHKIAHFLLRLLSIILFNDKLGLILIYSLYIQIPKDLRHTHTLTL